MQSKNIIRSSLLGYGLMYRLYRDYRPIISKYPCSAPEAPLTDILHSMHAAFFSARLCITDINNQTYRVEAVHKTLNFT